jgi:hypothetical protein
MEADFIAIEAYLKTFQRSLIESVKAWGITSACAAIYPTEPVMRAR